MIIQLKKTRWGRGEKLREYFSRKTKINPIWFPSHPPIYDVESQLFSGIQMEPKTKYKCIHMNIKYKTKYNSFESYLFIICQFLDDLIQKT